MLAKNSVKKHEEPINKKNFQTLMRLVEKNEKVLLTFLAVKNILKINSLILD